MHINKKTNISPPSRHFPCQIIIHILGIFPRLSTVKQAASCSFCLRGSGNRRNQAAFRWQGGDGTRGLVHLLRRTLPEVVGIPYVCLTRGSEAQRGGEDVVSADICTPAVHRVKTHTQKSVGVRATRLGSRHGSTRL